MGHAERRGDGTGAVVDIGKRKTALQIEQPAVLRPAKPAREEAVSAVFGVDERGGAPLLVVGIEHPELDLHTGDDIATELPVEAALKGQGAAGGMNDEAVADTAEVTEGLGIAPGIAGAATNIEAR